MHDAAAFAKVPGDSQVSARGIEPCPGMAVTFILIVTKPFSATWIG